MTDPKHPLSAQQKDAIMRAASSRLESHVAEGKGLDKYSVELKNWLEQQEGVSRATLRGRTTITVEFVDGTQIGLLLERNRMYGGCCEADRSVSPLGVVAKTVPSLPAIRDITVVATVPWLTTPGSKKVLLFDPLYDDWPPEATTDSIEKALIGAGYTVDKMLGNSGDLAHLETIESGNYGVIFMRSHGGILVVGGDDHIHIMVRPYFDMPPNPATCGYDGIGVFYVGTNWGNKYAYAFNDEFVLHHLGATRFPNTLMHLLVCHGGDPAGTNDMIKAFLDSGVGCYTGWTRNASLTHGDPAAVEFFDYLSGGFGRTVDGAIKRIESLGHSPDPGTAAELRGYGSCARMSLRAYPRIVIELEREHVTILERFPHDFIDVEIRPPEGIHIPDWSPWGGKISPIDRAGGRRFVPNPRVVNLLRAGNEAAGMFEAIQAFHAEVR